MSEEKVKKKVIKLSIIGDSGTGKTSIINRFTGHEFSVNTISNLGIDRKEVQMKMKDGNEIKLIIWDTAGQERFYSISSGTIKNSQGIIVCFSIDSKRSFNNVINWLNDVREISEKIPIVLFGNKCDIIEGRSVNEEEAQRMADNHEMIYFETSAKENINIKEGIETLVEEAYKKGFVAQEGKIKIGKQSDKKNKKKCC
jgi:small GTP-binding protein